MYKLEIETNRTVKRIEDPRRVRVVDVFFSTLVKVMDGQGKWTYIGRDFFVQDATIEARKIKEAIKEKKPFVEVDLN